jgi:DNA mismatch repair protein MutS
MPRSIVARANVILKELEGAGGHKNIGAVGQQKEEADSGVQLNFFQLDDPVLCQIRDEILGLDINNLTPFEALSKLNDIKKLVKGSN